MSLAQVLLQADNCSVVCRVNWFVLTQLCHIRPVDSESENSPVSTPRPQCYFVYFLSFWKPMLELRRQLPMVTLLRILLSCLSFVGFICRVGTSHIFVALLSFLQNTSSQPGTVFNSSTKYVKLLNSAMWLVGT